jgi:hypothetical protein
MNKTKKIKIFHKLKNRLDEPSVGTAYTVEKIKGLKGDVIKKYENGHLVNQKYMTPSKLKKLVRKTMKKIIQKKKQEQQEHTEIHHFRHEHEKTPHLEKGVSYIIEKSEHIDDKGNRLEGDIIKKYVNRTFIGEVFVPHKHTEKILLQISKHPHIRKMKKMGGNWFFKKKAQPVAPPQAIPVAKPVPIQAVNVQPVQYAPVKAEAVQQIQVADNTKFSQSLKTGLGFGIGQAVAFEVIGSIFDGLFS